MCALATYSFEQIVKSKLTNEITDLHKRRDLFEKPPEIRPRLFS